MEKIVANISIAKGVRSAVLQGREYYVAPVSMIVEGVLSGSEGPILYEGPEIQKSVAAWNSRPITMGHPESNGAKVSGCTPEALETVGMGMILNARWRPQTRKLTAEAWFDKSRFSVVPGGNRVEAALISNTKLEVSTGLFIDRVPVENGNHKGKPYDAKAANFAPDHLAILLDEPGACSIADGAGLLVNKASSGMADCHPIVNKGQVCLDKRVNMVRTAVYQAHEKPGTPDAPGTYAYVEEIQPKYVIFSTSGNGQFTAFKQNYEMKDEAVKLIGIPMKVTRKVTYSPVANQAKTMERKELLALLGEAHTDFVANLSDDQVTAIAALKTPEKATPAPVVPAPVANTLSELAAVASPAVQAQLNDAVFAANKLRGEYVQSIVANKKCQFTADDLQSWPLATLEKLATLAVNTQEVAPPTQHVTGNAPFYVGSPAPLTANTKVTETGFGVPSTL